MRSGSFEAFSLKSRRSLAIPHPPMGIGSRRRSLSTHQHVLAEQHCLADCLPQIDCAGDAALIFDGVDFVAVAAAATSLVLLTSSNRHSQKKGAGNGRSSQVHCSFEGRLGPQET